MQFVEYWYGFLNYRIAAERLKTGAVYHFWWLLPLQ